MTDDERTDALAVEALPVSAPESEPVVDGSGLASEEPSLRLVVGRLDELGARVSELAAQVAGLGERVGFLPRQIRQLAARVDEVTESISHPRVRDLLGSFLLLHDLLEQMGRTEEPEAGAGLRVLRDQVTQVLGLNGIEEIPETKRFDPALHKAVESVACATAEEDGEIAEVYRAGFRSQHTVLRYAEVVVKRHQAPKSPEEVKT